MDLKVRMIPKLKNNHSSGFVMLQLLENDTSFVILALLEPKIINVMFFKMAASGHFETCTLSELAVTFERYIGANFLLKWFWLSNPSRKIGRDKMVTDSNKMTLLIRVVVGAVFVL